MSHGTKDMWNNESDSWYENIRVGLDIITENAERAFPLTVWKMINRAFLDLRGKCVLVLDAPSRQRLFHGVFVLRIQSRLQRFHATWQHMFACLYFNGIIGRDLHKEAQRG